MSITTPTVTRGDVERYVTGRERVLGRRVTLPIADPGEAGETLAETFGGRQIAARWLHDVLDALEPGHEVWTHPDDCPLCRTTQQRLQAVSS